MTKAADFQVRIGLLLHGWKFLGRDSGGSKGSFFGYCVLSGIL